MMALTVANHGNQTLADPELGGEASLCFIGCCYLFNLRVCELTVRRVTRTLLFKHVLRVIAVGAEPKMIGVNTKSDITTVAYAKAVWNRPFVDHEGGAMGKVSATTVFKLSVAAVALARVEDAAALLRGRALSKTLPKRFQQFWRTFAECRSHAGARAILCSVQVGRCRGTYESVGTAYANECSGRHITLYHGGLNGYPDRLAKWEVAKEVLQA